MAEINSFTFTYQEVVEQLIKAAGVHEGIWMPLMQFGLAAGNFGPNQTELSPGAAIVVQKVGIQRVVDPAAQTTNLTVDAAKVNPLKG